MLALILPIELRAVDPLLESAYADGAGGATFALLRVTASLVLLSVPAAAMGATFPVASQWLCGAPATPRRDAGALYAANTVGAAIGALLAGFVLLPSLGLSGATWIGVLLNVAAAAGAWLMARGLSPDAAVPGRRTARAASPKPAGGKRKGRAVPAAPPAPVMSPQPALAAAALALSGFASLVLQVVWTRVLALILGPTTYAFSTMVAIFIAGIAVGAGDRVASRPEDAAAGDRPRGVPCAVGRRRGSGRGVRRSRPALGRHAGRAARRHLHRRPRPPGAAGARRCSRR